MESHQAFDKKRELYMRDRIEEKGFVKIAKNMLCLAYAYAVKSEIAELFTCAGCEENQGNQLGHDCVMLSTDDIIVLYFDEALKRVNHDDLVKVWREFVIRSSIPPLILQNTMQDQKLHREAYVKEKYAEKIKKFVKKIDDEYQNLFL